MNNLRKKFKKNKDCIVVITLLIIWWINNTIFKVKPADPGNYDKTNSFISKTCKCRFYYTNPWYLIDVYNQSDHVQKNFFSDNRNNAK